MSNDVFRRVVYFGNIFPYIFWKYIFDIHNKLLYIIYTFADFRIKVSLNKLFQ